MGTEDVQRIDKKLDMAIEKLNDLKVDVTEVKAKVNTHEDYIKDQKKSKNSIYDMVYRAILAIVVGWIAYKLGIS